MKPKPLKIDPQLTEARLQDAAGQDALPLLAFTLRYLYDQYKSNDELNLGSYEKLGRLKGSSRRPSSRLLPRELR